jgi:hypothetical protein
MKMVEREGRLGEDMGSVRRPVADGARQAAAQGIHVPGVGWKWANQAGCSGPRGWKRKGKEMKRKMGRLGIWPRGDLENSKGFPFYNLFTIIKLIWILQIQILNESSCKIKYNSTKQYKRKCQRHK